ncbi:MAG: hypothetical protein AAF721_03780 [Myxococcota bacterium]
MMTHLVKTLTRATAHACLLGLLAAGACSVETEPATSGETNRARLGKADAFGSCAAADDADWCGGQSAGNCYCDDACEEYGDCCADFTAVCLPDECPQTCGEWCSQAATCDVPAGCGNPGCKCPEPTVCPNECPDTCGEWCTAAANCEVPDGCENPGCKCAEPNCKDECPDTCGEWCTAAANCEVPPGCENPGCKCAEPNCG